MKYIGFFFAAFSLGILFPIFQNCSKPSTPLLEKEDSLAPPAKDIVFIMGEDKPDAAPYYRLASQYYAAQHPALEQVNNLRSLVEVRDFLASGEQPWSNIYLIVHGNPWTGLNMSILPEGPRINSKDLAKILRQKSFIPVGNELINAKTIIHLEACGLGNDPLFLHQLARALGGEDFQVPLVKASKHFVSYLQHPEQANQVHKYYTKPYYTFFETAKKPALYHLQQQLQNMYPSAEVDWMQALQRPGNAPGFQAKYQQFNVPVSWTSVFLEQSDIPNFAQLDRTETLDWVSEQEELLAEIEQIGIPLQDFRWQFKSTEYLLESGAQLPAVEIKGKTTVLCILAPIEIVPIAGATEVAATEDTNQHFGYSGFDLSLNP